MHRPTLARLALGILIWSHSAGAADPDISRILEELASLKAEVRELRARVNRQPAPASTAATSKPATAPPRQGSSSSAEPAREPTGNADAETVEKGTAADLASKVPLNKLTDAFAVPDSPAAAALGLPQKDVQHIETPKQLVAAAINGLDEQGNFQTGVSVDFAPMQLIWGTRPIEDFRYLNPGRDDGVPLSFGEASAIWGRRVLARTQISFASTKGTSEQDKSSKLALGLHVVLVSGNDAISNANPVLENAGTADERVVSAEDGRALDARGRRLNQWVRGLSLGGDIEARVAEEPLWWRVGRFLYQQTSVSIGAAPLWISPEDDDSYESAGATYWGTLALHPSRRLPVRFLANVMYRQDEELPGTEALPAPAPGAAAGALPAPLSQDTLYLAGTVQVGNPDFNASFSAAYVRLDQGEDGDDHAFRYSASVEKRVSNNSWLTLTASRDDGRPEGENETLVLGGIKVGLGGRDFTTGEQRARAAQFARD